MRRKIALCVRLKTQYVSWLFSAKQQREKPDNKLGTCHDCVWSPYNERERHSGTFFIKSTSYCVNYLKCLLVMLIYFTAQGAGHMWVELETVKLSTLDQPDAGLKELLPMKSVNYSFFFYYYYCYFPCVLSLSFCLLGVFTGCFSCCFSYTFFPFFVKICFYFYLYIF